VAPFGAKNVKKRRKSSAPPVQVKNIEKVEFAPRKEPHIPACIEL
jgi:hypothetical protein